MKNQSFWRIGLLTILASVGWAYVDWSNPTGATLYFDWFNGHNDTGLFGSPIIISDNTFLFFPSLFRAEASNGTTDVKNDTLTFDLLMKAPYCLGGVVVTEYGDYGILGADSSVSAQGQLKLQSLISGGSIQTALAMTPAFPVYSGKGMWSGYGQITGSFCNSVRVSVSNELVAVSSAGTTTYIEKKLLGSAIEIKIIPEPATVIFVAIGSVFCFRKRVLWKSF